MVNNYCTIAKMSVSRRIKYSLPWYFTSVPAYLEKMMRSPSDTSRATRSPLSKTRPVPTATTLPSCGFSFAESGRTIPLAVFSSVSTSSITTRSPSGFKQVKQPP